MESLIMQLRSQKIVVENLTVEISVHDLSFRMGFRENDIPVNHLYVSLTARDFHGKRIWTTPLLSDDGKVQAFSTVSDAFAHARIRLGVEQNLKTG